MKMMYGNVPVKSLHITKHDVSTNDATLQASDMQAGVTAYARGKKITGTGKSFEFAYYGLMQTNDFEMIPTTINIVHISSLEYPTQSVISLNNISEIDFTTEQVVSNVIIDGTIYPIKVISNGSELSISCDRTISVQIFYGKDNYV